MAHTRTYNQAGYSLASLHSPGLYYMYGAGKDEGLRLTGIIKNWIIG